MKLSDRPLGQMLLCGRNILTRREIGDQLLADPSSIQKTRLRVGECPLEVHDIAIVGWLAAQIVWVLEIELLVRATCNSSVLHRVEIQYELYLRMGRPCPFHLRVDLD